MEFASSCPSSAMDLAVKLNSVPAGCRAPLIPVVVFRMLWRLLINIRSHYKVHRLVMLPQYIDQVQNNPKFQFKYLADNYLARGLTVSERAACFQHHYERLCRALPERLLYQILNWDVTLHEITKGCNHFALTMGMSRPSDKEGELSLNLKIDDDLLFTLSFTIVPGRIVKSKATEVLLISRIQGMPGCFPDKVKLATKAMQGIRPRALLLTGLQGVAVALGIDEIAAACATRHTAYRDEFAASFRNAYDDFFSESGMVRTDAGFFQCSVPIEEKPLTLSKRESRSKAKKRRTAKKKIELACAGFLSKISGRAQITADSVQSELLPKAIESQPRSILRIKSRQSLTA